MAIVKHEDVVGYRDVTGGVYCNECAITEGFTNDAPFDQLIVRDEVENADAHYFCDKCGCRIG